MGEDAAKASHTAQARGPPPNHLAIDPAMQEPFRPPHTASSHNAGKRSLDAPATPLARCDTGRLGTRQEDRPVAHRDGSTVMRHNGHYRRFSKRQLNVVVAGSEALKLLGYLLPLALTYRMTRAFAETVAGMNHHGECGVVLAEA